MARTSARNFSSLRSSPAFVCVTTARICSLAIFTLPETSILLTIGGGGESGGGEGCWGAAGDGGGAGDCVHPGAESSSVQATTMGAARNRNAGRLSATLSRPNAG